MHTHAERARPLFVHLRVQLRLSAAASGGHATRKQCYPAELCTCASVRWGMARDARAIVRTPTIARAPNNQIYQCHGCAMPGGGGRRVRSERPTWACWGGGGARVGARATCARAPGACAKKRNRGTRRRSTQSWQLAHSRAVRPGAKRSLQQSSGSTWTTRHPARTSGNLTKTVTSNRSAGARTPAHELTLAAVVPPSSGDRPRGLGVQRAMKYR